MLEPHLYTAYGTFTAASSSVNIVEVTASTYSAHDTEAQAALLGYAPTTRPPKLEQQQQGQQPQNEAPTATPPTTAWAPTRTCQRQAPSKLKNNRYTT